MALLSPATPAPAPAGMPRGPGLGPQQLLPGREGTDTCVQVWLVLPGSGMPHSALGTMPSSANSHRQGPS